MYFDQVDGASPSVEKVWAPSPMWGADSQRAERGARHTGARPWRSRSRFASAKNNAEQVEKQQPLEQLALVAFKQISDEGSWMVHSQGDDADSRVKEDLLSCYVGISCPPGHPSRPTRPGGSGSTIAYLDAVQNAVER